MIHKIETEAGNLRQICKNLKLEETDTTNRDRWMDICDVVAA